MRTAFRTILVVLLVFSLTLCGCSRAETPAENVKKQITSGSWYADMSEGTVACYTFTRDNRFSCATTVTAGGKSAGFVREGTYEVVEENGEAAVILQYPDVNYQVKITCTPEEDHYLFQIAGCDLYQK